MLTDACSLKELCEFKLADNVTLANAAKVEDVAYRTSSDALVRLCNRLRYHFSIGSLLLIVAAYVIIYSSLLRMMQSRNLFHTDIISMTTIR